MPETISSVARQGLRNASRILKQRFLHNPDRMRRNRAPIRTAVADAMITVHQGKRYSANIALGFLTRFASNQAIQDKFRAAGFTEVEVTGTGSTRTAKGFWPWPDDCGLAG